MIIPHTEKEPAKASDLQDLLLTYLKSVDAERAADFRPKSRKKPKRK
jgi:hypothetical protein